MLNRGPDFVMFTPKSVLRFGSGILLFWAQFPLRKKKKHLTEASGEGVLL